MPFKHFNSQLAMIRKDRGTCQWHYFVPTAGNNHNALQSFVKRLGQMGVNPVITRNMSIVQILQT